MTENFADLLNADKEDLTLGKLAKAKVLRIERDWVILDAGLKSESFVPSTQFYNDDKIDIEKGDDVNVILDSIDDGLGFSQVSRDKARRMESFENIKKAFETQEIITGFVVGKIRGGYHVDINRVRAFLPGSLADARPAREIIGLEGQKIEFKVISIDEERNNILISRKAVIEAENSVSREQILERVFVDAVIEGVVKNVTDYGAFIDLEGIDGLLHNSDIAWRRIRHPSEALKLGQKIQVKVLRFDQESNRVSLGMKQLTEDPWLHLEQHLQVGQKLKAVVTNLVDYGCFAEILNSVEGLVHVSEMDWFNKNISPEKFLKVGQEIDVVVLNIDIENRRVSLGMKQNMPNPWEAFAKTHQSGDKMRGVIKSVTDFGLFVNLEDTVDGLVHSSDIAWGVYGDTALQSYKKDEEVDVIVLQVDVSRERISLGIKQLTQNHFAEYIEANPVGAVVTGIVKTMDTKRILITLSEHVEGFIYASDLDYVLKEGDSVEFKISYVDNRRSSIQLVDKTSKAHMEDHKLLLQEEAKPSRLGDYLTIVKED